MNAFKPVIHQGKYGAVVNEHPNYPQSLPFFWLKNLKFKKRS